VLPEKGSVKGGEELAAVSCMGQDGTMQDMGRVGVETV